MLNLAESRGNNEVFTQINTINVRTEQGIRRGFFRLGDDLRKELRQEMLKKNKRGRTYVRRIRGGARRRHVASAPGQTPASLTGNYRNNVGYQIRGSQQLEFGIRDNAPYAVFLENGTRKMQARPGIGNAVQATRSNARAFFDTSLNLELNKK